MESTERHDAIDEACARTWRATARCAKRFWVKVEQAGDCWVWAGPKCPDGYGLFSADGKCVRAHRWAYEFLCAEIPAGLQLDHLCENRPCVNPWHLEPVTAAENNRRSRGSVTAINARKTHCKRGHPLAGDNLLIKTDRGGKTERSCRECKMAYDAAWQPRCPVPHGTAGGYTNHKCRCEPCKSAWLEWSRRYRAERKARDPDWRKGERQRRRREGVFVEVPSSTRRPAATTTVDVAPVLHCNILWNQDRHE